MDVEMTPAKFAMMILKVNVLIFILTVGVNTFSLFPYMMHLNQVVNNLALDVANRNYTTADSVEKYIVHLKPKTGATDSTVFSQQTYKNADMSGGKTTSSTATVKNTVAMGAGSIIIASPLSTDSGAVTVKDVTGDSVASVTVTNKSGNGSLILSKIPAGFNPLEKSADTKEAMDNGYGGGKIIQRGNAFTVKLKTRYKLSGGAFGFMINTAIPMEVETQGVTTQYYQYDK